MKRLIFSLLCAVLACAGALAQFRVTGTVFEPTGDTAIGASIIEKGNPKHAATTDIDGNFSIYVSSGKATLVISYVGMETQEVPVNNRAKIEVTLQESKTVLNEVVIVGYGTQKKINATGSVKTIGNDVLESRPVANAVQGLQGAVAGLNITNDNGGAPGEAMNINIRGVGSIGEGSNSSPLVLIDGMEGDLSLVNPNDIENISVLKDAAAASIYGSRAPFGVILVTTKSGNKETRVTYSGNVRIQQPVKLPNMVDSYTMALMINDAWYNSNQGNQPFGQNQLEQILRYQRGELQYGTEPRIDGSDWKAGLQAFGNTNWYDVYLKKNAVSQEHNVSVTGGNDKVTYYLSGSYMDQAGLFNFADEKFNRLNISARLNIKFNNWVSLTWISRFVNSNNEKPSILGNLFFHNLGQRWVTEPLYLPNGEYSQNSMVQSITKGGRQNQRTQQYHNQANLLVTPLENWNIHIDLSSRLERNPYTRQWNPVGYTLPDGTWKEFPANVGAAVKFQPNASSGTFQVNPGAGEKYYEKAQTNIDYFSTNIYSDYSLTLNEKHNFKFLLGMQTEYFHTEMTRIGSKNIAIADKPFIPSLPGDANTLTAEKKGEWSSVGFFGRINYNYDDRYMAEINMRGDGASRFPTDQRWGYFPSFSVGWNIAQEKFFEPILKTWHYFKLRASYGTLGNQNTTSFYPYYPQMIGSSGNVIIGGEQVGLLPVYDPYSASLTWEKIENIGAGVDLGFFNSRLNASFDWYQRTTKDMVGPAQALPGIYGGDAPKTNNAELRTRGWEFEVSWRDRINKDWSYGISASLSDYKTVITKYDSPDNSIEDGKWYQGKTYGDIWGYQVIGIAKSDAEMAEHLAKANQSAIGQYWGGGDLMYRDLDNSGAIDPGAKTLDNPGDLCVIGNNTPRFAYSFTLEAQWRWIDFRAFFQGIGKRDVAFPTSNNTFWGMNGPYNKMLLAEHLDYFRYAGSTLGANYEDPYYPRLRTDENNRQVSDRYLQNGAYLRLKNIQIGFSLPESPKIKKWIKKARLYVSGENLFTITKLKIYDPEAIGNADAAYVGKTYPQFRTWSVGLELTF